VEGNGRSSADIILCGRCEAACDSSDRFCRQCGLLLHDTRLPSQWDEARMPVPWRPAPASIVVKGAAIVAAGTVAEMLIRRIVRGLLSADEKDERAKELTVVSEPNGNGHGQSEVVTETLLFRRIRFRR
jgi:hypothetical protein